VTEVKDGAFDPAWSSDGATIAFAGRQDGKTSIMSMRPDGTAVQRLTEGRFDRAPAWSPDATELAFLTGAVGSFELAVLRLQDGAVSTPRRLTDRKNVDPISGISWTA
jgi:Tol biopolymer transport system component